MDDYFDWHDKNGYIDEVVEPVDERWLCEYTAIFLRPNQLYYFRVNPDCEKCKELDVYSSDLTSDA